MNGSIAITGAPELKRYYHRNLLIGFGTSAASFLAICIGIIIYLGLAIEGAQVIIDDRPVIKIVNVIPPVLSNLPIQQRVAMQERPKKLSIGIPVPVAESLATSESEIPTVDEINAIINAPVYIDLNSINVVVDPSLIGSDFLPAPGEFVPREDEPVRIINVQPVYPELAQRAGVEGIVWIDALIDKDGEVRDVRVRKASGANAGFEDAATEATYQMVWKPAIANGQPVAVWVTFKVEFIIKNK